MPPAQSRNRSETLESSPTILMPKACAIDKSGGSAMRASFTVLPGKEEAQSYKSAAHRCDIPAPGEVGRDG